MIKLNEELHVKIVQWKSSSDVDGNLNFIREKIEQAERGTIVVFPEYSMLYPDYKNEDGFKMRAETSDGNFINSIRKSASKSSCDVLINFVEKTFGRPLNTSLYINSEGFIAARYSKTHLFDSYGFRESSLYAQGYFVPEPFLVKGEHKAGLQICYDIRFPEITRLYSLKSADILFVQAGFYKGDFKYETWKTLLMARAMENGMFVVAANQCGEDFLGHSMVISPYGKIISEAGDDFQDLDVKISMSEVAQYRENTGILDHRRLDLYDVKGL